VFVNDASVVLMVKEGSSLEFAWKLHLQWLRGVSCVIMIVHCLTRHHRQTINQECMPWCVGIPSSWSLLPTCKMVSSRIMKIDIDWLIWHELLSASHQPPSLSPRKVQNLLAWVLEKFNAMLPSTLFITSWFVCPLPMSKCFYCKSFLWHLSHFLFIPLLKWWFSCSQIHTKPWTSTTYIHSSCKWTHTRGNITNLKHEFYYPYFLWFSSMLIGGCMILWLFHIDFV
jgi:hypothetical protein